MDTFKVVQSKEITDTEALKQMQLFLKREAQVKEAENNTNDLDSNRIDDNIIQQINTVKTALQAPQ
jgi:hypothetical protein